MELLNEQELQKISEKNWIQYGLAPNGVNQLSNTFQARKAEAREEKRAIHNTLKSEKAAWKVCCFQAAFCVRFMDWLFIFMAFCATV